MAIRNFITTENRTNLFNINNPTYIKKYSSDNDSDKSKISKGIISSGGKKGIKSGQGFIIDIHNAEYITFSCTPIAVNNANIEYNFTNQITDVITGTDNIFSNKKPILVNERYYETINNPNKKRYFVFYLYDLVQYEFKIKEVQIEIGDKLSPYTEYCGRTSFKKMIKVGNITQRLLPNFKSLTSGGIKFVNNGDGSISATGTNTVFLAQHILAHLNIGKLEKNHKYLILNNGDNNIDGVFVSINFYDKTGKYKGRATTIDNPIFVIKDIYNGDYNMNIGGLYIYITKTDTELNNMLFIPQLFDLTEMYGAGNEPSTVAEFRERFPDNYYPYQRSWLTYYNDKLVVDGKEV